MKDSGRHVAGIDIGGTKTMALSLVGGSVGDETLRLDRPDSPADLVRQLQAVVLELSEAQGQAIEALGLGIAGAVDRSGMLLFSPHLPEMQRVPLQAMLEEALLIPVVVENDATAATWAEHRSGAAVGKSNMVYIALGTGIGVGIVAEKVLIRGAHGLAGEAGHMVIDRAGAMHVTGVRGPWEMTASGSGLGQLARDAARRGALPSAVQLAGDVESVRGEHLTACVVQGDADALVALETYAAEVAVGAQNLIYMLDPQIIVLGGGVASIGEPLRRTVEQAVNATLLGRQHRPAVQVVIGLYGDRSAVVGAAMLASERLLVS